MAWDPTKPGYGTLLASEEIRNNFETLDVQLVSPLLYAPDNGLLIKIAGPKIAGIGGGVEGAFLSLIGGVPAWVSSPPTGMPNPMTDFGDLIIGAAGGVPQRLAAGAEGLVLTVLAGGIPGWASGGGGGGGGSFPLLGPNGSQASPTYAFASQAGRGIFLAGDGALVLTSDAGPGIRFITAGLERWVVDSVGNFAPSVDGGADVGTAAKRPANLHAAVSVRIGAGPAIIASDGGGALGQRNGVNPQSYAVYEGYVDGGNFSKLDLVAGPIMRLRASAAGAGVSRPLIIGTLGSSRLGFEVVGVEKFVLDTDGHVKPTVTEAVDLGTAALAWRDLFVGRSASFKEQSVAPATPPAGQVVIYPKIDKKFYQKDDTGAETLLGGGGGGGAHPPQADYLEFLEIVAPTAPGGGAIRMYAEPQTPWGMPRATLLDSQGQKMTVPSVLFRYTGLPIKDINNTTTETSVFPGAAPIIKGGTFGLDRVIQFFLHGNILNSTGAGAGFTLRFKLGGVLFWTFAPGSGYYGSNANRYPWWVQGTLTQGGNQNNQNACGVFFTTQTAGIAGTDAAIQAGNSGSRMSYHQLIVADTATDKTLEITIQNSAASLNLGTRVESILALAM